MCVPYTRTNICIQHLFSISYSSMDLLQGWYNYEPIPLITKSLMYHRVSTMTLVQSAQKPTDVAPKIP